eukprot:5207604-Amphidinium_carterae.1
MPRALVRPRMSHHFNRNNLFVGGPVSASHLCNAFSTVSYWSSLSSSTQTGHIATSRLDAIPDLIKGSVL